MNLKKRLYEEHIYNHIIRFYCLGFSQNHPNSSKSNKQLEDVQFGERNMIEQTNLGITLIITADINNDNYEDIITSQKYFLNVNFNRILYQQKFREL